MITRTRKIENQLDDESSENRGGALARGLGVLAAINDLETSTISGLVTETGLAKPTVVRLVQTLVVEGFVQRDPKTQSYSATSKVASLARSFVSKSPKDSAIQDILDGLAQTLKWPTEYLIPDGYSMVIAMNNRQKAPIKLRLFERRRFPMLQSGSGIAFVASKSNEEQRKIEQASGLTEKQLEVARQNLKRARDNGYVIYHYPDLEPNLCVLSIMIPDGSGALTVPHFDDVLTEHIAAKSVLPGIRHAAEQIATLSNQQNGPMVQ